VGVTGAIAGAVIGRRLELPPALLARHPELADAQVRRGGVIPIVGGWPLGLRSVAAVTLWRTIFLARNVAPDPELLLHELRHVHQFGASATFPFSYVWECLRHGYRQNRYEIDARNWARERVRQMPPEASPGEE
jgi:hypothetical protein